MSELGRYRQIYVRIWKHPGFRQLSSDGQRLALYLLTGPQTNRIGLYTLSVHCTADDLGNTLRTITKGLADVSVTFRWTFDPASSVFFIPSWWRWNPPANVNVLKGNLKDLQEIPPCALMDAFARNVETLPETFHQTFLKGIRQRLGEPSPTQYQYQDQDQKQEQPGRAARGSDGKTGPIDIRILREAQEVLREFGRTDDDEILIDTLREYCQKKHRMELKRTIAVAALLQAQEARTA